MFTLLHFVLHRSQRAFTFCNMPCISSNSYVNKKHQSNAWKAAAAVTRHRQSAFQIHRDSFAQTRSSAYSSSSAHSSSSRMMLQDCRNWITSSSSLFRHSFNNRTTSFDFEWRRSNHVSQTQESIERQESKEEKDKNFKFVRYKLKCFHLRCSRIF